MEAVAGPPVEQEQDLRLLLEWEGEQERSRVRQARIASVLLHGAAILLLASLPKEILAPPRAPERHLLTPLIAPPAELTQKAPNRGKPIKEFYGETILPRPRLVIPPSPPPSARAAAPKPLPPPALPEPPKVETGAQPPKLGPEASLAQVQPPPQIQAQEKPKLAFESPGGAPASTGGAGKVAVPNPSVSEAVRSLSRGESGGRTIVGDAGVGEGINLPALPGKAGSSLELLSDPKGIDFKPYLLAILANVRRNWFAVMPESAKLGRRGKVAIQFAISRDGRVPKLVIVLPSGADALDRAAVAGISASNPFPPLPTDYRGDQIRLQFTFLYNMPVN
jgi:TonB family protein